MRAKNSPAAAAASCFTIVVVFCVGQKVSLGTHASDLPGTSHVSFSPAQGGQGKAGCGGGGGIGGQKDAQANSLPKI